MVKTGLWSLLALAFSFCIFAGGSAFAGDFAHDDLIELNCQSQRRSMPEVLSVQAGALNQAHEGRSTALGRVGDRGLRRLIEMHREMQRPAQSPQLKAHEFVGAAWNPSRGEDSPVFEGADATLIREPDGSIEIEHRFAGVVAFGSESDAVIAYKGSFSLRCTRRSGSCPAVQTIDAGNASPRGISSREEFSCQVRKLKPCDYIKEVKRAAADRRGAGLRAGADGWKSALDAEKLEQESAFLLEKYSCSPL